MFIDPIKITTNFRKKFPCFCRVLAMAEPRLSCGLVKNAFFRASQAYFNIAPLAGEMLKISRDAKTIGIIWRFENRSGIIQTFRRRDLFLALHPRRLVNPNFCFSRNLKNSQ